MGVIFQRVVPARIAKRRSHVRSVRMKNYYINVLNGKLNRKFAFYLMLLD